jgi:hypothetical protein
MGLERKTLMISVRIQGPMMARLDYIMRNVEAPWVKNRSTLVIAALEAFACAREDELRVLGVLPKKAR